MNQCLDIAVADLLSPLIRWITTNVGVRLFPTLIPNPTTQLENSFLERTKKIEKKGRRHMA